MCLTTAAIRAYSLQVMSMSSLYCGVCLTSLTEPSPTAVHADIQRLPAVLGHLRDTLGLWFAFFACLHGIYLVFGWLPAMLSAHGLDVAAASSGLAAYNFGGVLGVLLCAAVVTVVGSRAPLL